MNPEDVKTLLEAALTDCQIQVESEGSHFNIVAVGDIFEGKRAVQRQQIVYAALNEQIDLVNRSFTLGGMVASWWQPLASAIVNGLLVSTVLTLLLTPAMLLLPGTVSKRLGFRVADHQFEDEGA